jgi:hypothetical protein
MATAWAVGGLCWIGMRAGRDIFDLGVGDLLQMTGLFAVGAAAAWAVSAFVLPRWVGGWTLHLARGGVFGVLAAPAMIDGRCAAGTIPVPGYTLFLFAPGQLLAEPLAAIEVIGPGFVFVAVLATMLSASIAGRPNA